jgi:superfamily I DNA and/or RNA helicase
MYEKLSISIANVHLDRTQSFKIFLKLKQLGLAKIKVSTVDAFQGGERGKVYLLI